MSDHEKFQTPGLFSNFEIYLFVSFVYGKDCSFLTGMVNIFLILSWFSLFLRTTLLFKMLLPPIILSKFLFLV